MYFKTGATHYRWMVAAQENVDAALEITPSTTTGGTTYNSPVAVFKATGNVGIGTTSPDYTLDVAGNAGINEYLYHNGDSDTYLRFLDNNVYLYAGNQAGVQCSSTSTTLQSFHSFYPDGDFQIGDPGGIFSGMSLRINNSGSDLTFETSAGYKSIFSNSSTTYFQTDVGIGNTSPDEKLHVTGNTRITSRLYNTQHTSSSLSANNWYRIIEITGSSGRGKCEFSIGGSGGSGTPSLVKATVNTAWANANSTIKVDFNSKSSAFSEFRVVRNSSSNKSFVDVKLGTAEDNVLLQVYPIAF